MRLLRLKIKNIASLKGEHHVDFETIQSMGPLFAITGETGAGKSSVLNAIGLALYGQIYKKNVTQVDVVTLGEKEGEIQLIFQVAGKSYLADWKAKVRKQTGELLKQPLIQRQVFPMASEQFDAAREEPIESVERLLNLDFDQFCKCIILNQGEFARFLSSSFSERKEILEKLYPGELLEKLGTELKNQLDVLKKERSELDIKLGELKEEPLDGEALRKEKGRLKIELGHAETWSMQLERIKLHVVSLTAHHLKFHENKKRSELIRKELSLATTAYNQVLKEHEKIQTAYQEAMQRQENERPGLHELLKVEQELEHSVQIQADSRKKLNTLEAELVVLQEVLHENQMKTKSWNDQLRDMAQGFRHGIPALRTNRGELERIIDLFTEQTNLQKEMQNLDDKLEELELAGKEVNQKHTDVIHELKALPSDLSEHLLQFEKKKLDLLRQMEDRQKAQLALEELERQLQTHQNEVQSIDEKLKTASAALLVYEQEFSVLEATLKLQDLTDAIEVCLTHAARKEEQNCPVCEGPVPKDKWNQLLVALNKSDRPMVQSRIQELSRPISQLKAESNLSHSAKKTHLEAIDLKAKEIDRLKSSLHTPLSSLPVLEKEIDLLKKQIWNQENLKKEEAELKSNLARAREIYGKVKMAKQELSLKLGQLGNLLSETTRNHIDLLPLPLTPSTIEALREDLRVLTRYLQHEATGEKLKQEKSFLEKDLLAKNQSQLELKNELASLIIRIEDHRLKLQTKLNGKSAQDLLDFLNREAKEWTQKASLADKDLKQHELGMKEFQSRLYTIDDQLREYDLLFVKELHALREMAQAKLPEFNPELSALLLRLKNLNFNLNDPIELFDPIQDLLDLQKERLKDDSNKLREAHASAGQRLQDWEKRQDKIQIFEMARAELQERLQRLERLFEVLGKDELRSFVLSLVEENLILATNEELTKLCQGRYEILHQAKGKRETPEFYILDKFREGERRKVSTLSGGETFMVSLAMALALAEMTRGQAEIDSLFIDEGFGTLDQESLEDVLDMLNQIQTRGLMVGLISHIKALTDAIPVNLVLSKKSDGTSSVSIQSN